MKSRKFPSIDEAITYLSSKGTLTYWGRIGHKGEICLYTFVCDGVKFDLNVYDTGLVEIREE